MVYSVFTYYHLKLFFKKLEKNIFSFLKKFTELLQISDFIKPRHNYIPFLFTVKDNH